jgi:transposase
MGQIFEPYEPDQALLFPPSPRDWLPDGHLAYFISETVEQLDLSAFYAKYEQREDGRGNCAYEPRLMLKLLIYSYCTGIFSSRKISAGVEDRVAMRYLAAGHVPSHRTVARFRHEHLSAFRSLFVQVVQIAHEAGLVKMGTVAVDGSRVKANASKHKAMSYGRMKSEEQRLRREIKRLTALARTTDKAEDEEFGPDFRGDELPEELSRRETRLTAIRAAKRRLEQRQAEEDAAAKRGERWEQEGRGHELKRPNGTPPDARQDNFTDPESRIMKTSTGGFEQCFNAQIAVDAKEQIIVAADVTQSAADVEELLPMQEQAETNTGQRPKRVLADAGYKSEDNLAKLEQRGVDGYVSLGRREETREKAVTAGPATARMGRKLKTKRGRARFKMRKAIVEPAVGWIKHVIGFRAFSLRGHAKVTAEWDLVCMATNLRRMNDMIAWT